MILKKILFTKTFITLVLLLSVVHAGAQNYDAAARTTEGDLERVLAELAQLRNDIAEKKIPLAQEINQLEDLKIELTHQRDEVVEQATGVNRIKAELEQRDSDLARQNDYLHTALGNYIEEFLGNALHVGEIQLYSDVVERARNAKDNAEIPLRERYEMQVAVLQASLGRLEKMVAGYTFEGECEVEGGDLVQGNFAIVGPIGMFSQGGTAGLVDVNPLVLRPLQVRVEGAPEEAMSAVTTTGSGILFLDSKLDEALDILNLKETLFEHIDKGGVVMYPILTLALVAFLISLFKVIELLSVKKASPGDLETILKYLRSGHKEDALRFARGVKGPSGRMLTAAMESIDAEEDLIEEILYEQMLGTQPKLERFLPFIAVTAATAPLLGLLGTVTGMINTFKLITIFGTGDARQLSSG
ncbi:MAG: hypothetical protein F7B06_01685, partial [Opitutae bacterium]|nr:hypothetical protein [Opitutae bacterium]